MRNAFFSLGMNHVDGVPFLLFWLPYGLLSFTRSDASRGGGKYQESIQSSTTRFSGGNTPSECGQAKLPPPPKQEILQPEGIP